MRQDAADPDDEVGVEDALVDDDGHTRRQAAKIAQIVVEGVVAVDGITSHDFGAEFEFEFLLGDLAVRPGGDEEGDAPRPDPGRLEQHQQMGDDPMRGCRSAEIVDDDESRRFALRQLHQRRPGVGPGQGQAQGLLGQLRRIRRLQHVDAPRVRYGQLDLLVAVPGARAQGDAGHR